MKRLLATLGAALCAGFGAAQAAPVDLSTWQVAGTGTWNLAADNNSVKQTVNGNPTIFFNNQNSQGLSLSGQITVETASDDDYIGFVLGYNSGDLNNPNADYILIDWKQGNQTFFGCPASRGLSISHVSGQLGNNTGAWCHDPANNVTELQRAANLSDTGWADNTTYDFQLTFTETVIQVFVNGVLELNIAGNFANGSFGFYNYSQANVRYAGIQEEVAPPVNGEIPLPAAFPLMLAGLGGLGFVTRRRKRA